MVNITTDIDIDFADRTRALAVLPHLPASMAHQGKSVKHNTGVYFQNIPVDPLTGLASIPYEQAEDLGYFKLDFINNSIYQGIEDEAHLERLVAQEPEWGLLADEEFVGMLAHIHNHFEIVNTIKPQSIEDLSVVLALIRPGKRHLLQSSRSEIDKEIWTEPTDGSYFFKRSHSVAYALSIVVQMNLLVEQATL